MEFAANRRFPDSEFKYLPTTAAIYPKAHPASLAQNTHQFRTRNFIFHCFCNHLTPKPLSGLNPGCENPVRSERLPGARSIFLNGTHMASERQRQANRRNGSKGGPRTEAGKQRSRGNSIKHGLSSSTLVVLPEEHEHEYEAILRGFRDSFRPQDATEEALVLRLAQAQWRSLRSRRVETGILHITAATERNRAQKIVEDCPGHLNPHNAIAVGFMTSPAERWQMYLRYDAAISREFFRTLEMLTQLQKARQPKKPSQEPVIAAAAGVMSDFGIRSVSQMSAEPADLTENKELTHESKAHKNITPRRASGALGDLLTQLRTHLTAAAEKKGAHGDYLRLLEFYRETNDARDPLVGRTPSSASRPPVGSLFPVRDSPVCNLSRLLPL